MQTTLIPIPTTPGDTSTVQQVRDWLGVTVTGRTAVHCPCCRQLVRNDRKGITRWMAYALADVCDYFTKHPEESAVHLGSFLKGLRGSRDHCAALLRHWGLIDPVEAPAGSSRLLKGSRGLSGWYRVTPHGWNFLRGHIKVRKDIVKQYDGTFEIDYESDLVSFDEVTTLELATNESNQVVSGETRPAPKYEMVTTSLGFTVRPVDATDKRRWHFGLSTDADHCLAMLNAGVHLD